MKKKFVEKGYHFINKYKECNELETKKIKYGLEAIYNLVTKTVILFFVSLVLGVWKEYLLLIIVYSIARMYTYGIHAKSTILCWITSTTIYILGSLFVHYIILPNSVYYILWAISFISFFLWAPADTPAKPLIHPEKRRAQKFKACMVSILFLLLIIYVPDPLLINAICYCLIIQSICINPITYRITNTPFDNYKIYMKSHGLN